MVYGKFGYIFTVLSESPWMTFKDFLQEARNNPGKLKYASPGPSSAPHIVMEHIFKIEKVKVNHVPMGGGIEAVRQLLGKHLDAAITPDFAPYIKSGKTRGLAVVDAEKRFPEVPDIPTFAELGYRVECPNWMGICAPRGVDPQIIRKLSDAFKKAYEDPSFQEVMLKLNLPMMYADSESFKALLSKEYRNQGQVLKELGFTK
jgi:tripartite-type tricarboxylate transporter receptor subunit TctC